jgi:hypothetical protein
MTRRLEFFFFVGSTYSYLSISRAGSLAKASGVDLVWRPFSVRTLMREQNNAPFVGKPLKLRYMWRDSRAPSGALRHTIRRHSAVPDRPRRTRQPRGDPGRARGLVPRVRPVGIQGVVPGQAGSGSTAGAALNPSRARPASRPMPCGRELRDGARRVRQPDGKSARTGHLRNTDLCLRHGAVLGRRSLGRRARLGSSPRPVIEKRRGFRARKTHSTVSANGWRRGCRWRERRPDEPGKRRALHAETHFTRLHRAAARQWARLGDDRSWR